ncbi:transcription antitermination factor NusB [Streptococcus minor]|uniref:Transcription antitermination protein NusB n=1 Tax=Streptococcus minor TaxID=229549 RepID=A0A3P1VAZ2_9STRE|nr:transcription antitermination factor NusB [Streptococcus minor]RRD31394.1 transcription antitermination factor NusB [Streptococcus minor]
MKNNLVDSRRHLRQRALQAIVSLEFGQDPLQAAQFSYLYDQEEIQEAEIPLFLLQLVTGVDQHRDELDRELEPHLKSGWSMDRLTTIDKSILRLGLFEIRYCDETPDRVAVNEAIELAKDFSDQASAKFINGILTHFVTD